MKESYNPKYYSLGSIPKYRLEYINVRLKWFVKTFGLKRNSWPLDCVKLLNMVRDSSIINFNYGLFSLPQKYDAVTKYDRDYDVFLTQFNRNKVRYPFAYSKYRRVNFTICHEIGHVVLGHPIIPRELKTKEELELEEAEADEFAARLLMPEGLIYMCNFHSLDRASEFFNVSNTALWKRLNNMKRLDFLSSRSISSCPTCGNTRFSPFSEFCGICGQSLRGNLRGMFTVHYDKGISMDRYKHIETCPRCGNNLMSGGADKCSVCHLHTFNYCMSYFHEDEKDECSFANTSSSRFCEMCGRPTYYYQMKLMKSWQEELDGMGMF